jgi:hypothetical protein
LWLIGQVQETETEAQTATRGEITELRAEIARRTRAVTQREAQIAS